MRGKTNHRERPGFRRGNTNCEIGIICESIQALAMGNINGNGKNGTGGNGCKCITIRPHAPDREKLKRLKGLFSMHAGEEPSRCPGGGRKDD